MQGLIDTMTQQIKISRKDYENAQLNYWMCLDELEHGYNMTDEDRRTLGRIEDILEVPVDQRITKPSNIRYIVVD